MRFRYNQRSPPARTKTATRGPEAKRPKAARKFVTVLDIDAGVRVQHWLYMLCFTDMRTFFTWWSHANTVMTGRSIRFTVANSQIHILKKIFNGINPASQMHSKKTDRGEKNSNRSPDWVDTLKARRLFPLFAESHRLLRVNQAKELVAVRVWNSPYRSLRLCSSR